MASVNKADKYEELVAKLCDDRPGLNREIVKRVISEAIEYGVKIGFEDGMEYAIEHQKASLNQLKKNQ